MNKVLVTFGWHEAAKWLELTGPLMMKYAMMHGYDFHVAAEPPEFRRASSWYKLDLFGNLLDSCGIGCGPWDTVLWLDADVVIKEFDRDVLDDFPRPKLHANVVHHTEVHGHVPNCGVWIMRHYSPLLASQSKLEDSMWEQARYCKLLGSNDQLPMEFPNGFPDWFQKLPYEWNVTLWDKRGIPSNLRFFHATASRDPAEKLALIKEWVKK